MVDMTIKMKKKAGVGWLFVNTCFQLGTTFEDIRLIPGVISFFMVFFSSYYSYLDLDCIIGIVLPL